MCNTMYIHIRGVLKERLRRAVGFTVASNVHAAVFDVCTWESILLTCSCVFIIRAKLDVRRIDNINY